MTRWERKEKKRLREGRMGKISGNISDYGQNGKEKDK
jgi:hypothetical protein